jgi:hypothetical protein
MMATVNVQGLHVMARVIGDRIHNLEWLPDMLGELDMNGMRAFYYPYELKKLTGMI